MLDPKLIVTDVPGSKVRPLYSAAMTISVFSFFSTFGARGICVSSP